MSDESDSNSFEIDDLNDFNERQICLLILREVRGQGKRVKNLEYWRTAMGAMVIFLLGAMHLDKKSFMDRILSWLAK